MWSTILPALPRSELRADAQSRRPLRLHVQRLERIEDFAAIGDEWDQLDEAIFPRTPFTSRLWNTLWWKHFRRHGLAVRDEFRGYVIRDQNDELIAVAPMMLTLRPAVGPLQSRELQFFGADPNLTEIRGLVCRAQHSLAAATALLDMLHRECSEWSWACISGVRDAPANGQRQAPALALQWTRHVPDYFLRLGPPWDEFKSRLPRNTKESLRKCYNSLRRDGVAFEFEVVRSHAQCDAALSEFFRLHAQRSACDAASVRHQDVFRGQRAQAFMRDFAAHMARGNQLRIFQMRIGGKVVGSRVGFQLGSEIYLYYSGYDCAWRKYSLMTTVVAEAIQWCLRHDISIVNLSTGTDPSKTRWRPEHSLHSEGIARAPGLGAHLAFMAGRLVLRRNREALAQRTPP
jgi:CelD/BcsL family acetyltransferase involved in cellulose biosynthesis